MSAVDRWKPSGPGRPLITAAISLVLAWTGSLIVLAEVDFFGSGDPNTGLIDALMAVPMALTGVAFAAALRNWHSGVALGAGAFLALFAVLFFLVYFAYFDTVFLYFVSAYFLLRTAASILRNKKMRAGDDSYR